MTTPQRVVEIALSYNGLLDGAGYDVANPFSADLGRPAEAWCADFATDVYRRAGLLLPSLQAGCRTGFAYVPDAVDAAHARGAARPSWQAEPGDLVCFDWNGDGVADHVELATSNAGGTLLTVGGNSGPSNVDGFRGDGGVHRHEWPAPAGQGNPLILTAVDTSKLVTFAAPPPPPAGHPTAAPRLLMLKTPFLAGRDVAALQSALNTHDHAGLVVDGVYGPATRAAVAAFQRRAHIAVDGVVGPATRAALGIRPEAPR